MATAAAPSAAEEQPHDLGRPSKATPEDFEALKKAEAAPDKVSLYIKRCGYGNMCFYEGSDPKNLGPPRYFVEVARKLVGWDITLRRGGKTGEPILHLKKAVRFLSLLGWDKGSQVRIKEKKEDASKGSGTSVASSRPSNPDSSHPESFVTEGDDDAEHAEPKAPEELNPSFAHKDVKPLDLTQQDKNDLDNELTQSMKQLNIKDPQAAPVAILQRKHAFRSNRNTFEFNGHTYAWDYMIFLGALHTLKNLDTNEIVATCQLKPGVTTQSITAWGLRQNGCLEIMGEGVQMQDMIVATLIGMLEWRKHNNKVWIILMAAMPV